ncbi:hypothetical protein MYMA111404_03025 [Mycoplasma marinum]|uniref:Histidinol-phosphatase n=1 Tax=Mycoplasma marinum TaxID=1937190 RepID=A0A4R0XNJ4_9MOLU|nr:hypothetical protein [Mycoplasma marinum]TCG10525.1 hypothetical protein C4B24_04525 [Mycoplasma marinum]
MEWKKFDLHHHTSNDLDGARRKGLEDYGGIVDEFVSGGGSLLAITNHDFIDVAEVEKYEKYIEKSNYDVNVLYGVEVSFELKEKTETKTKKTGHIIFIFDGTKEQCDDLNSGVFKNVNVYKKNSPINEGLQKMLIEIKKKKIPFYAIPHFHKGSENIEYETMKDDFYESIISFDLLESKFDTDNNRKSVERAIDYIEKRTGLEKGKIFGTDAHDFDEFKNNFEKKVPWVYAENNFYGISQIIRFNKTRVGYGDKPTSIENYIKSFEIDGQKINFERGLNTIIGRRGTGKSFLMNSLKEAIENNSNSLKFNGSKILSSDILYMKQNQLTENITEVLKVAYEEKANELNLVQETGLDDVKISNSPTKKLINELLTIVSGGLSSAKKVVEEGIETKKFENLMKLKSSIYDSLPKDKIHLKIKNDLTFFQGIDQQSISPWLVKKLLEINNELILLSSSNFVKQIENNDKIKHLIHSIKLDNLKTASDTISSKFESFSGKALEKWNKIRNNFNAIEGEFLKISQIYKEFSEEQVMKSLETKESILTKQTVKIDTNKITLQHFIDEVILTKYTKNQKYKPGCLTWLDFLQLEPRYKKKNIDDLFLINFKHFIGDVNIDDLSIGEKHQRLLEEILLDDKDIIFLDQPDDDLDAMTIQEQIVEKLSKWNVSKQIIVVSHDPKIVINSDSKQIILANFKGDKEFGEQNYKNIDFHDIKDNVYKILDAKKQYPYIRFKEYGGYDGN